MIDLSHQQIQVVLEVLAVQQMQMVLLKYTRLLQEQLLRE
jgi:hypothetical protein